MANNKALNELRGLCEGIHCIGGEIIGLVHQAIAHENREHVSDPAHQMAEQQLRLVKAKADLLELDVAERRRAQPAVFYDPTTGDYVDSEGNVVEAPSEPTPDEAKTVDFSLFGLRLRGVLRPTSECGIPADGMVNATVSFDVADGSLVGMRIESVPVTAATGIAESLAADQAAKRDERREREAKALAEELRIEELRGFHRGCNQALRIVLAEHDEHLGSVTRSALSHVADSIRSMRMEG